MRSMFIDWGLDLDEAQMVTDMTQMFRYEPGVNITGSNGTAQNDLPTIFGKPDRDIGSGIHMWTYDLEDGT